MTYENDNQGNNNHQEIGSHVDPWMSSNLLRSSIIDAWEWITSFFHNDSGTSHKDDNNKDDGIPT